MKTFDEMCCYAHYPPSLARGEQKFKRFECPCCGYAPSEKKWRADQAAFNKLSDEEQQVTRKKHNEVGVEEQLYSKHFNQQLYLYPGVLSDMEYAGVDGLHLIFLNAFKHLFNYTLHQGFPVKKLKLIKAYLKKAGFYSYDAAADDENPVSRWIGREVWSCPCLQCVA
eukprot:1728037-Pleurochrysis_carterae.AAC.1